MKTLIIPCAGRKQIDNMPQYLVRHPNGRLLLERSFEGIQPQQYDRIIVVLLQEDVEQYHADQLILDELQPRYPLEIIALSQPTTGPAETVYQAMLAGNVSDEVVIKDSDNYISLPTGRKGNFVAGLDLNKWDRDIHNLRNKSFLIVNEQNNLLDVIEKQVRSDIICLGLYGFQRAADFIKAYDRLNDASYPISKLYISHVISYLIGYSGRVFHYVAAEQYENWGDDRLFFDMQQDYTLSFIDLDFLFGNAGKVSADQLQKLQLMQMRGATFIGFTTGNHDHGAQLRMQAQAIGLKFLDIVCDCPYSRVKEIIDSDEVLNHKTIVL